MIPVKLQALVVVVMTATVAAKPYKSTQVPPPACQVRTPGGKIVDKTYFKKSTAHGVEKFKSTIKHDEKTVVTFVPSKGATISRSSYELSGGPLKIKLVSKTGDTVYVQVQLGKTCSVGETVGWTSIDKVDYFSIFYDE